MKRSLPLLAPTLALLCFTGSSARADQMGTTGNVVNNVPWTYNWTPSTPGTPNTSSGGIALGNGTGGISFTNEPSKSAMGTSNIVATNLRVFSTNQTYNGDAVTNGKYVLSLTLGAGNLNKTVTFTGTLGGFFSANNSNVTNTFTSPLSQVVSVGKYNFTVTIGQFAPPGPPTASNAGSISAQVVMSTGTISGTPEPSSLILSCLGLGFGGLASWRKRRQARML